jgi:hypothetical protein
LSAEYFNKPGGNVRLLVGARISQFAPIIIEKYDANSCEVNPDDRYELRYTINRDGSERHPHRRPQIPLAPRSDR